MCPEISSGKDHQKITVSKDNAFINHFPDLHREELCDKEELPILITIDHRLSGDLEEAKSSFPDDSSSTDIRGAK